MTQTNVAQAGAAQYGNVRRVGLVLTALAYGLLVACSHSASTEGVGAPVAIITPVGYKPTPAAGATPMMITVRTGADVVLTGEDSDNGNISITQFVWTQTDATPLPQPGLIYRNSSTVSFTAPSVATTLNFQLTVTNAVGLTGSSMIQVLVIAASDPDRFLTQLVAPHAAPHHFRVALSLTNSSATPGAPLGLSADIPVCVTLTPSISYLPRSGPRASFALPVQVTEAKWLASAGATAGFSANVPPYLAFTNPVVSFELPVLNDDLLFAAFNQPGATATDINNQLVASDVLQAYVQMSISAAPGTCASPSGAVLGNNLLMMEIQDENGNAIGAPVTGEAAAGVTFMTSLNPNLSPNPLIPGCTAAGQSGCDVLTADDVLRATALTTGNTTIETRESAQAYYDAIDPPPAKKTTLPDWLAGTCFDANSPTYGAGESGYNVVHATYTNNYDLGFGRDMYFANCANGNMASVVINYPSLEAAANKLGDFLAVAMEYTPAAGSAATCFTNPADPTTNTGACFAKFYVFAPNDRNGVFERVLSANFDRRGQKYVPGACTACHGGAPNYAPSATPGAAYSNGNHGAADVNATFMPWDLGAMLFSDQTGPNADPSFSCSISPTSPPCESINPSLYTVAAQSPNIQNLNALVWRTYQAPEMVGPMGAQVDRYAAVRALLTKWYGGDPGAATAHAFDDSATPANWATPGQSAPSDLYHQVFAHHCRSCHTQADDVLVPQFSSYSDPDDAQRFTRYLAANLPNAALSTRVNVQQLVFGNGEMPLSRLTADRFWVDFQGGQSAAQTLAVFINADAQAAPVAVDVNKNVIPPGAPLILPLKSSNLPLVAGAQNTLTRFQGASLDALTQTLFVSSYQWSLCMGGAPAAPVDPCPGTGFDLIGTPVAPTPGSAASPQPGASLPAFPTNVPGTYYLTLTAGSGLAGSTPVSTTYQFSVAQSDPDLPSGTILSCPSQSANYNGTPISIDVSSCLSGQAVQLGDPPYAVSVTNSSAAWTTALKPGACPSMTTPCVDPTTGLNNSRPLVAFNFTPAATQNATLDFTWCDGNGGAAGCASGTVDITLQSGTNIAPAAAFVGYWTLANPDYPSPAFPFTVPSPGGMTFVAPIIGSAQGTQPATGAMALAGANSGLNSSGFITLDTPSATLAFGPPSPSNAGSFSDAAASLANVASGTLTGPPTGANSLPTQIAGLTYAPSAGAAGAFVTCDINGTDLVTGSPCTFGQSTSGATFGYMLTDNNTSTSQSGIATINIQALTSFYTSPTNPALPVPIYSSLGSIGCGGGTCHGSSTGGNPTNIWLYSASDTKSTHNTLSSIKSASLVAPGNPEGSPFYTAPCVTGYPAGTPPDMQLMSVATSGSTAALCQVIYQWILEGGVDD